MAVTGDPPFWTRDAGWTEAADLKPGDRVYTARGGWARVRTSSWRPTHRTVYNLEVARAHTYFVGDPAVWVHNECDLKVDSQQFGDKWRKHASDYGADAGNDAARKAYRRGIRKTFSSPDEVRRGPYHPDSGGGANYRFYRRGNNLLITDSDGKFVTMFPDDGSNNWWKSATPVQK